MTCPSEVARTVTARPTFSVLLASTGPIGWIGTGACAAAVVAAAIERSEILRTEISIRKGKCSSNEEVTAVTGARRPKESQDAVIEVVQDDRRELALLRRREQVAHGRRNRDQVVHRLLAGVDVLPIGIAVAVRLGLRLERLRRGRPHRIGVSGELGAESGQAIRLPARELE